MRFLCCSDLHNGVSDAARLAARVRDERLDALLAAGDLGHWLQQDQRMWAALAACEKPVLAVPGNHDGAVTYVEAVKRSGVTDIDGRIVQIGDVSVIGWGWREAEEEGQPGLRPDPRLVAHRALHQGVDPKRLVLLTHLPPWGVRVARTDDGDDLGDEHLRDWVDEVQAWAVVCGHVHFPTARTSRVGETLIVNGQREGYVLTVGSQG